MGAGHFFYVVEIIYLMKGDVYMLEKLKNHMTSKGVTVNQYLKRKHPNGEWLIDSDELSYNVIIAHLLVKYRWKIINGELEAVNGRAIDLTPDLHSITRNINSKRDKNS
ncbi:hypothetical protein ACQKP0_25475 [Heyndrickxia sp. NPDC080065]|uniref:hypothetical protein n=1 Tax=Heyndrickxia sp. NPDC080065 TaxID=3390568 RepID=UPI003D03981D